MKALDKDLPVPQATERTFTTISGFPINELYTE